jgi:beta-N-acetylhexosaminidase
LYIDNLVAPGDQDSYTTLLRIIDFFVQKYREDSAFAQRVDASVERILSLKFQQYKTFNLEKIIPDINLLKEVGVSQPVTFELARQAVTLIHPLQTELSQVLPRPPELRERLLFLTDVVTYHQCGQCPAESVLAVDALQNVVMRLYGPRTGGQINAANLASFTLLDLKYYLGDNKENIPQNLDDSLKLADWVVIALLNKDPSRPESEAFRQLLAQRPELLRNKKVVVFAFGSPNTLDATDISKLSAYYALYSKTPPFLEVAARILFQELPPAGAMPVTVSGAGYDLEIALSPDPNQVISLDVDLPPAASATPQGTETATPTLAVTPVGTLSPVPTVKVGDMLPLMTGVIFDHNHNPVPDGTLVNFIFTVPGGDSNISQQITVPTLKGVARASYRIQSSGSLEVRVESAPAFSSKQLRINITSSGVAVTAVTQTQPPPTPTITPTSTSTPTPTQTATPSPTPSPPPRPGTGDWFLSLLVAWGAAAGFFWLGRATSSLRWAVRWGLLAAAGGLLVYTYLAAGLPGGQEVLELNGTGSMVWLTLFGSLAGWLAGFAWQRLDRGPRKRY